jgi:hypothetical protein
MYFSDLQMLCFIIAMYKTKPLTFSAVRTCINQILFPLLLNPSRPPLYKYFYVSSLQPVNVEGIVMYVRNREQTTTKNTGLSPIRRVTLRDRNGAQRLFSLWRENADIPGILQATVSSTVFVFTNITYNPDQGYSSSKGRFNLVFESAKNYSEPCEISVATPSFEQQPTISFAAAVEL